ncbi:hypothetical protein Tco_1112868 [Tanacetum coccineum]|uniref:Transposase (Putative), gypsy type n=1 Tax=Tanacetum coccineum TaxID=301880 RepID=A0ABQ5IS12_9ASTR
MFRGGTNPICFTTTILTITVILMITIIKDCDGSMTACNGSTAAECLQLVSVEQEEEFMMDTEEHRRILGPAAGFFSGVAFQQPNPACDRNCPKLPSFKTDHGPGLGPETTGLGPGLGPETDHLSPKMDLLSFIQTADPTKVRIGERQRAEGEPKLLDTTVGRVVPLLPVAPARASSELEASVDKLFDEGGSGSHAEQGDSVSGGHGVGVPQVSETAEIVAEDAAPVQPRRQRKRKTVVSDAGEPSHPPKKLREDHGTSTGPSVAGKSRSALQRLLAGAVLNPEVGVVALPTLPFITSSVSVTPEREDGDQTDFMAGANLRTITAPPRFVISSDSSHHSGANIAEAEVDSFARPSVPLMTMTTTVTSTVDPTTTAKEKFVESSIFGGGSSSGAEHTVGGFSGLTGSDFIVGGIRTVVSPDTDLQKVYVPQWSVTNGSCLDDGRTCREMVDEFAPPKFFASIRGMEHDELFTEFNVGAARQISLSAEVRMRAEFNIREKRRLSAVVEEKNSLLKARDEEVASLKAQLLVKEAEAAEAIRLRAEVQTLADRNTVLEGEKSELDVKVADLAATVKVREQEVADLDGVVTSVKVHNDNLSDQVHTLEVSSAGLQEKVTAYENFIGQLEKFQDDRMREMNEKFDKLDTDLVELALHLEERFYPHLLTTIYGRRWLLTHGLELAIAKCLNSTEYLSSLGAAIGKAAKKADFRCLTEVSSGSLPSVLMLPDRSPLVLIIMTCRDFGFLPPSGLPRATEGYERGGLGAGGARVLDESVVWGGMERVGWPGGRVRWGVSHSRAQMLHSWVFTAVELFYEWCALCAVMMGRGVKGRWPGQDGGNFGGAR